jgi:hypothetical protein
MDISEDEGGKNAPQSLLANLEITALKVIVIVIKFNYILCNGEVIFRPKWKRWKPTMKC